jgi:hypothetical protein
MRNASGLILFIAILVGCENKAHQVQQLQEQYNAANAAYQKDCPDLNTSGAERMLTGEKLTSAQIADLEAKKKAQEARCKPQADHLAALERQILAAQQ